MEVARRLGISQATVSRVVKNPEAVSPEMRERVRAALDEANYVPNLMARGLVSQSSRTIGVLTTATTSPSTMIRVTALTARLMDAGWLVIQALSDGSDDAETRALEEFRGRMVDGLVGIHRPHLVEMDLVDGFREEGKPVVVLSNEPVRGVDTVAHDVAGGIEQAVAHLAELGHRSVGLLRMASDSPEMAERETGFRAGMLRQGLPIREKWIVREAPVGGPRRWAPLPEAADAADSDYDLGFRAAERLLAGGDWPTAVVCSSDRLAIGAMRAFRRAGLRIPRDVAVTGFDGLDEARFAEPPLTTIESHDAAIGWAAADLLLARLTGTASRTALHERVPSRLIARESTLPDPPDPT